MTDCGITPDMLVIPPTFKTKLDYSTKNHTQLSMLFDSGTSFTQEYACPKQVTDFEDEKKGDDCVSDLERGTDYKVCEFLIDESSKPCSLVPDCTKNSDLINLIDRQNEENIETFCGDSGNEENDSEDNSDDSDEDSSFENSENSESSEDSNMDNEISPTQPNDNCIFRGRPRKSWTNVKGGHKRRFATWIRESDTSLTERQVIDIQTDNEKSREFIEFHAFDWVKSRLELLVPGKNYSEASSFNLKLLNSSFMKKKKPLFPTIWGLEITFTDKQAEEHPVELVTSKPISVIYPGGVIEKNYFFDSYAFQETTNRRARDL